jgi:predicted RNase H-like HicB family nuclease
MRSTGSSVDLRLPPKIGAIEKSAGEDADHVARFPDFAGAGGQGATGLLRPENIHEAKKEHNESEAAQNDGTQIA